MKISSLLLLFFLFSFDSFSQAEPSSEKVEKHRVSVNVKSMYPLFYIKKNNFNYIYSKGEMVEKNNIFNSGLRVDYMYKIFKNTFVGIEYEFSQSKFSANQWHGYMSSWSASSWERIKLTPFNLHTQALMVKIDFFGRYLGETQLSISHQFGIGMTSSKVLIRDVHYDYFEGYEPSADTVLYSDYKGIDELPWMNPKEKAFNGFNAMYELSLRYPIGNSLYLNGGFRWEFNYLLGAFKPRIKDQEGEDFWFSRNELLKRVEQKRAFSFFNIHFGVSYIF